MTPSTFIAGIDPSLGLAPVGHSYAFAVTENKSSCSHWSYRTRRKKGYRFSYVNNSRSHFTATTVRFRQDSASVLFCTNSSSALNRLPIYLYPYEIDRVDSAEWMVSVWSGVQFAIKHTEVFRKAPTKIVEWGRTAHVLTYADKILHWIPEPQCLIVLDRTAHLIEVYCTDGQEAGYWGQKLVRLAMTTQLKHSGGILMHAGAVALSNNGVLIAGQKGQGKTSTLLALMRYLNYDYVGNDRLLLRVHDVITTAYGWPKSFAVGIGTLMAYRELEQRIPEPLRDQRASLSTKQLWRLPTKINFLPEELLTGGRVVGKCIPQVMIWPSLEPTPSDSYLESVPADQIVSTLLESQMFMLDEKSNDWLGMDVAPEVTALYTRRVAEALAHSIPCYRLRGGCNPARIAEVVSKLLLTIPTS